VKKKKTPREGGKPKGSESSEKISKERSESFGSAPKIKNEWGTQCETGKGCKKAVVRKRV